MMKSFFSFTFLLPIYSLRKLNFQFICTFIWPNFSSNLMQIQKLGAEFKAFHQILSKPKPSNTFLRRHLKILTIPRRPAPSFSTSQFLIFSQTSLLTSTIASSQASLIHSSLAGGKEYVSRQEMAKHSNLSALAGSSHTAMAHCFLSLNVVPSSLHLANISHLKSPALFVQ